MDAPIGVIDSGVGGLTVVKRMLESLPNEPIIYIGDDARCPYGPRTPEEVITFTMEMANALQAMGIKMLVIACNTATAVALDKVRSHFTFPVIGVIDPGARAAVKETDSRKIAVLATSGTIQSGAYQQAIHDHLPTATIHALACPEFVPLVESGQYKSAYAGNVVQSGLQSLVGKEFDTAILGCTHYPLLKNHIQNALPEGVKIISSAVETVHDIEKTLRDCNLKNYASHAVPPVFFTSGSTMHFREIALDWLAIDEADVRTIAF
ncbi:glutamate racemase [Sporosarcina sp. HYO08]|uniref:glutamate racemase n=1 Tax=Sporosarcina sp. HYO08 TaxID=1759557 RepID=UPI000792E1A3|nr:glutamate racemase [Sporosarcina sp. HYO08]KXH87279.1 glutamate racemase [Sporosarcina sp. HYO08]